jgi:hypothetical protein
MGIIERIAHEEEREREAVERERTARAERIRRREAPTLVFKTTTNEQPQPPTNAE